MGIRKYTKKFTGIRKSETLFLFSVSNSHFVFHKCMPVFLYASNKKKVLNFFLCAWLLCGAIFCHNLHSYLKLLANTKITAGYSVNNSQWAFKSKTNSFFLSSFPSYLPYRGEKKIQRPMVAPALYNWPLYFLTRTLGKIRKDTKRYEKIRKNTKRYKKIRKDTKKYDNNPPV